MEVYSEYMKREAKLGYRSPKINNKLFMPCREYACYHCVSNFVVAPTRVLRVYLNCVDTTERICIDVFCYGCIINVSSEITSFCIELLPLDHETNHLASVCTVYSH